MGTLVGAWRLERRPGTGAERVNALVLFTEAHYAAISTLSERRPLPRVPFAALEATDAQAAEALRTTGPMQAGTYSVSGSTLKLHCLIAKNQAMVGSTSSWTFWVEADELHLRSIPDDITPSWDLTFQRAAGEQP